MVSRLWLNTSGNACASESSAFSRRPRKSGTNISMRVVGEMARTARMQATKCAAPPSRRSSRSTEVMTTYLSPIAAMADARCAGSSTSSGPGRPWATSQNGQRRVHSRPMIMNVAVPPPKHSPRFGHEASSHTVFSWCSRSSRLSRPTSGCVGARARIQVGLRSGVCGTTLIGMRATLSAPFSGADGSMRGRVLGIWLGRCLEDGVPIIAESVEQSLEQPAAPRFHIACDAKFGELSHAQPRYAARVDLRERREIHVHIERKAMIAASPAYTQAKRGDFPVVDVHARRTGATLRRDTILRKQVAYALFQKT